MAEVNMSDLNELPPNSHTYRREMENAENDIPDEAPEKKTGKVISGTVTRKKKSLWRKFVNTFLKDGDSIEDIRVYVLEEVIVPSVLEMIHDSVDDGISMLFGLGSSRRRSSGKGQTITRINYSGRFNDGRQKSDRRDRPARDPNRHDNLDDFYFESRAEAEQARDALLEILDTYKQVTVADYLDLIGVSSDFPDHRYGWTDLGPMNVKNTRNGYRLELPREIVLNR